MDQVNKAIVGLILFILCFSSPLVHGAETLNKSTYLLAIGACPPWKKIHLEACKTAVDDFTQTFKEKLSLPSKNIKVLLGKKATYDGLVKGLHWLKKKASKDSRVIFYANVHGGFAKGVASPVQTKYKLNDVLVLWTKDKPFTIATAVATGKWILVSDLRGKINKIGFSERIIILDSCHSEAAALELLDHKARILKANKNEAIIVSANTNQVAHFNKSYSMALFTEQLLKAVNEGAPDLAKAFNVSQKTTHKEAIQLCSSVKVFETIPPKVCQQRPVKNDPSRILSSIRFAQ